MDRRQRKTKDSIFRAFIALLSQQSFNKITVNQIIDLADVGRATFYAHFETKDFLLRDLCAELFDHLFNSDDKHNIFHCDNKDSVFLHLFKHVKENDNNISKLLTSNNDDIFLDYFKKGVKMLVTQNSSQFEHRKPKIVPEDFWINHVTSVFIETLRWWLKNAMTESPEQITEYFLQSV